MAFIRHLLLLLVLLTACKTAGAPGQRQELRPQQQKSEVTPPQSRITPQSIPRELFPDAPEKTKSVDCFRTLTAHMSVYSVVQKCGRPDEELGSGIYIFVWHMTDGSSIAMGTPSLDKIYDVKYIASVGKELLAVAEKMTTVPAY